MQECKCAINNANMPYKHIAQKHGYSRNKRPDLAQVNVMFGVNQRQIPLYFEVFAGNTADVTMFEYTLQRLKTSYQGLLRRMKKRYIIFDRGNVSDKTVPQLDQLCDEWRFDFIAGGKSTMFKEELSAMDLDHLPLIFQHNETKLYGYNVFCFQCRYNYFDWEVKPKTVRLKCQHCNLVISIKKASLKVKTQSLIYNKNSSGYKHPF